MKLRPLFRQLLLILFSVLICGFSSVADAASPADLYSANCWEIAGASGKLTWVEIHNGDEARSSGIAHVEVLARKSGDPIWEIEHVCPHLAITTEALKRSVVRPLREKSVYTETFDAAFARWKLAAKGGTSVVCTTSIEDFLRKHP
jgi:hypothetical protein